jgi:hypothetical protein
MAAGDSVLKKLLERLMAGLLNGPGLNCRPHNSRQRIDLTALGRLDDLEPAKILAELLGSSRKVRIAARVPQPRNLDPVEAANPPPDDAYGNGHDNNAAQDQVERALKPWRDQQSVLSKLRTITEDARTYEQDTGVNVLSIGFPLLQLPPGALGARAGTGRKVLAPVAFIPVNVTLKRGVASSIELRCHGEGVDLVTPNVALLAWLQQQLKSPRDADLFADAEGENPWGEIATIVRYVAGALEIDLPDFFKQLPCPASGKVASPGADATPSDPPPSLPLIPAPRAGDEQAKPQILLSAVLGLYPLANQGLIEDMEALAGGERVSGPIESFIKLGVALDAPPPEPTADSDTPVSKQRRDFADERLVSDADPCQARAVRHARQSRGLVVHGPPGTGKSQTIANVIGDHLARGQRVLLVCDKRTALDVVYYRLRALGLGELCAVVHDPQRDQRDFYKAVRAQLDELVEASLKPGADRKLELADRELAQLHASLTAHWSALHERGPGGEVPLHELVGRWLTLADSPAPLNSTQLAQMSYDEFCTRTTGLKELFTRAISVEYPSNPWTGKVATPLSEFLQRSMADVRARVARGAGLAQTADETIHPSIPPFIEGDLAAQARERETLAGDLERVTSTTDPSIRKRWADQDVSAVQRARQRLNESASLIDDLRVKPLDAELSAALDPAATTGALNQQIADLGAYEEIAGKWLSFLHGSKKKAAAVVLRPYGLILSPDGAARVKHFLITARQRLALTQLLRALSGDAAAAPARLHDDELQRLLADHSAVLTLIGNVDDSPQLAPLRPRLQQALVDPAAVQELIEGLQRSPARATAISALLDCIRDADLLRPESQKKLTASALAGKPLAGVLVPMSERIDTLENVIRVGQALHEQPPAMKASVKALAKAGLDSDQAIDALRKAVLAGEIGRRLHDHPHLQTEDDQHLQASFDRYRELERAKRTFVRDSILHRWRCAQKGRLLVGTGSKLNTLGAKFRGRFVLQGERAMRLRKVIELGRSEPGGDPLCDLRPVWMASPETVAQLFPRQPLFDVVIFDEASQCRLEEALPVLTRAHRLVVAGDQKQLPPTRFFESAVVASDQQDVETDQEFFEAQQGQTEDLLSAALNLSIEQAYLDVHYRSRNADLIEFSNDNFYGSRLQPIPAHPSHRARFAPLRIDRIDGIYEKGRNPSEAARIVQIVRDLLKIAQPPSIGIACFNLNQRNLIVEKLDELAAEDHEFAQRLAAARIRQGAGSFEGLFVKNLENVQGDERDHIIISTTYGPAPDGKFRRQFGPLGSAGGGRRLNVLVTRARQEVHLVTSIPTEAYRSLPPVPPGQVPTGGWLLFRYLQYAEEIARQYEEAHRILSQAQADEHASVEVRPTRHAAAFSQFSVAMARRLCDGNNIGSQVHWGNDGFMVDLALQHPHRAEDVTIGVLCDSTRYDKAADPVEWDLFRTAIHESQGWTLHRLWTPHFFRDPETVTGAVCKAVEQFLGNEKPSDAMPVTPVQSE